MILISGYVCIYSQTLALTYLSRLLQASLKKESSLSGFDVSVRGKSDFRKKNIVNSEIRNFLTERYVEGINLLVVRAEGELQIGDGILGKISISLLPSPLDEIWSPIGKDFPQSKNHTQNSTLRSLASHEGFVFGRALKDYPNLFLISVETVEGVVVSPDQLHQFSVALAESLDGTDRWMGVLDAKNHISTFSVAEMLVAKPETVTKMDSFFLFPHLTVFGKNDVVNAYADDISATFPKIPLLKTNLKQASIVSLKTWDDRSEIFLPQWSKNAWKLLS
ncbi:hypothetical protein ACO0LD_16895 [Undibacterium sp. Ji83W]|uniref:hypothetical protein n=1 Tax=Undibacterium sp. Ji83W TaxID=3413043 RepID=UPI003BF12ED7